MLRRTVLGFLITASAGTLVPRAGSQPPAASSPPTSSQQPAARSPQPTVIYLVRHAEKLDDSRDPPLNDAGRERARQLAHLLGQEEITWVWSTDFQRTRETARPLADRLGLQVTLYSPADGDFVARLRRMSGRHLVVGHSNTVPMLVEALGGEPGPEIVDSEYDRLYVLVIEGDRVMTLPLRFGAGS